MKHIRSADNPGFKLLRELAGSARERRRLGQTLLDGVHLVDAWLARGLRPVQLIVSEAGSAQPEIAALMCRHGEGADVIVLSDALFARASPVDTPSGVLARIDIPPAPAARLAGGNCIVLDAVQDAGNLGTLLRTAAAAGVREVLLGEGCAQAWSPRVLRAGMGAHLALTIHEHAAIGSLLAGYRGQIVATRPDAGHSLFDSDLRGPLAWLFGNEGAGLSPQVAALATREVRIPMPGAAESLNVAAAAAVCLFEQVRQNAAPQLQKHQPDRRRQT